MMAVPRVVGARGRGYAYLFAWAASNQVKARLFDHDGLPLPDVGRAVRRYLFEGGGRDGGGTPVQLLLRLWRAVGHDEGTSVAGAPTEAAPARDSVRVGGGAGADAADLLRLVEDMTSTDSLAAWLHAPGDERRTAQAG